MAVSVVLFYVWENRKTNKAKSDAQNILKETEDKKDKILQQAKKEAIEITSKAEKIEERILDREEKIEKKLEQIEQKYDDIASREDELKQDRQSLDDTKRELDGKLQELSQLTVQEARDLFLDEIRHKYENDGLDVIKKYKKKTEDSKKEVAREIILKSIQQYAGDVTSEVTTTVIEIPSDDIKGKLIGKE
ncbi:MAG: Rnase Y domain-containing protein [Patescibacteria group bacterium]